MHSFEEKNIPYLGNEWYPYGAQNVGNLLLKNFQKGFLYNSRRKLI